MHDFMIYFCASITKADRPRISEEERKERKSLPHRYPLRCPRHCPLRHPHRRPHHQSPKSSFLCRDDWEIHTRQPDLCWMRRLQQILGWKYQRNLHAIYVHHQTFGPVRLGRE